MASHPPSARARPREPQDADVRREANRAAMAAVQSMRLLRTVFIAYAVLMAIPTAVLLAATGLNLITGIALGIVAVNVAGALLVVHQPLPWTVVAALLGTPPAAFYVYGWVTTGTVGLEGMLTLLGAAVFWLTVPMAANLSTTMRLHPDLWVLRRARGEDEGRAVQRAREDARKARKRVLVGLAIALGVVGLLVAWALLGGSGSGDGEPVRAPPPGPSRTFAEAESGFRAAWNAHDVAAVKDLVAASERGSRLPFFDAQVRKRGWTERLPLLGAPETKDHGRNQWSAAYVLPGKDLPLEVFWEWERTRWVIVNWSFPNT